MIAQIRGKLLEKAATHAVVESGGLGMTCQISLKTSNRLPKVGEETVLFTLFLLSGSGSMGPLVPVLYGFYSKEEKRMFELLLSVSRLGASKALAVLSTMEPAMVSKAITNSDINLLSTVKGIGKKQGERIVLDLKDKIRDMELSAEYNTEQESSGVDAQEAIQALEALGFNRKTAEKQVKSIMAKAGADLSVEELIKQALVQS